MSFPNIYGQESYHLEQLRHAWQSLSYDIITQRQLSYTPPLTPEMSCNTPQTYSKDSLSPRIPEMSCNTSHTYSKGISPPIIPELSYNTPQTYSNGKLPRPNSLIEERKRLLNGTSIATSEGMEGRLLHCNSKDIYPCCPPNLQPLTAGLNARGHHYNNYVNTNSIHCHNNQINKYQINLNQEMSLKRKYNSVGRDSCKYKKLKGAGDEVACQVNGLLSLSGCRESKYDVTVDELKRRVNNPECLTKVDMISYVRLAKNTARTLLDKNDIKSNQHNRRSEHTVLSKMCESEAKVLANGIHDINSKYFPSKWFASKTVHEITKAIPEVNNRREAVLQRIRELEITRFCILNFYFQMEERKHDEAFDTFNLISHSFGMVNMQNHLLFLISNFDEEIRQLKTN